MCLDGSFCRRAVDQHITLSHSAPFSCNTVELRLEDTGDGCPVCQHHVRSLCLVGHWRSQMFFQGMSVMFVVYLEVGGV